MKVLVTGGRGFIGSAVVRHLIEATDHQVVNLDKGTYAATDGSTELAHGHERYHLIEGDIADPGQVGEIFANERPDAVMHLAAESHVDRSIDGPGEFIRTNLIGTYTLLEGARQHVATLDPAQAERFRFHHVSTDEVYGTLSFDAPPFTEQHPYDPRSPYSATKAGSDHLVRAWGETFDLPILITNCSNNYGPYHFPEKLIPLTIIRALRGQDLPVYGTGENVRDWLFVGDHAEALVAVVERGTPGETYNIGGNEERSNLDVVQQICDTVDELADPLASGKRQDLITFVTDRPGHDLRYAIDASHIAEELDWTPSVTFEEGLRETVEWYLANEAWWGPLVDGGGATDRRGLDKS